ncbi:hypothetical protein [Viridibacillus arvi]|uniref:hypothetical protein n=1 Tax=Viridibacillus arvi TaxID=263475 RepID=UPI0034CE2AEE
MIIKGDSVVFNINNHKGENIYKVTSDQYQNNGEGRKVVNQAGYSGEVAVEYLEKVNTNNSLEFDTNNELRLTSNEVLEIIDNKDKITIVFANGFKGNSDTEDVFRGLLGDTAFEESEEMMDAVEEIGVVRQTFFLSNAKTETPFNERGMIKRLIEDNFWTMLIFHDHPLKDGCYAVVINENSKQQI